MRRAVATAVTIAIIGLISSIITVVFEKESDGAITKLVYEEANVSIECEREFPKIIFTDKEE